MSSSRPSDTGTELPDPADLPDADGATAPDVFSEGVGFRDDDTDEYAAPDAPRDDRTRAYAATPGHGAGHDADHDPRSPASSTSSVRRRLVGAWDRTRPWSAWTLRAKLVASMLALFTVLSLATGAFTVIALDRQLTGQVDDQLRTSISQLVNGRPFDTGLGDRATAAPGARRRGAHRLLPPVPVG